MINVLKIRRASFLLGCALGLLLMPGVSLSAVPVNISIKYISLFKLSLPGMPRVAWRGIGGNLSTDAQIFTEVSEGNKILQINGSELRMKLVDLNPDGSIVNIDTMLIPQSRALYNTLTNTAPVGQPKNGTYTGETFPIHYDTLISGHVAYLSSLLTTGTVAEQDKAKLALKWNPNAINIYINDGSAAAIKMNSKFILMNQNCGNTPSCIMHEVGHTLLLEHTFGAAARKAASDLLIDPSKTSVSKDPIARRNFNNVVYANLTPVQKAAVDQTYSNIMSYHVSSSQVYISKGQLGLMSKAVCNSMNGQTLASHAGYAYVEKVPTPVTTPPSAVTAACSGRTGSYAAPYPTIGAAVASGAKTIVLKGVDFSPPPAPKPATTPLINANVEIITRAADSHFGAVIDLSVNLEASLNPVISTAMQTVQYNDALMRKLRHDLWVENRANPKQMNAQKKAIKAQMKQIAGDSIKQFLLAEKAASGKEKVSIQMGLGGRYKEAGDCALSSKTYNRAAAGSTDPMVRSLALRKAQKCQ